MRKLFPLIAVLLLAAVPASAQSARRTSQSRTLGAIERSRLLQTGQQRSGGVERGRALQAGTGAPAQLGSAQRRSLLRGSRAPLPGHRRATRPGSETLGSVMRTALLDRDPKRLRRRKQALSTPQVHSRVLAHRLRRR